ncbi:MAG: ABC transporter substrate-binding protein [Alphaproteobacteria bacterium]|nr:ABC transporter substrate-binding protein [Alphaproteobacteria bacterium]
MRRRDFTVLVGGASIAWLSHARAQGVSRIGFLQSGSQSDGNSQRRFAAFREGMNRLGWVDGQSVHYEVRWGAGNLERISAYARELVEMAPSVLVSNSTPATAALLRATKTIPIVFAVVSDPVGDGFVASLSRPGGNVTGFMSHFPEIVGKWLDILKEIAPEIRRTALIYNPKTAPFAKSEFLRPQFELASRRSRIEPIMLPVANAAEIKQSIASVGRTPGGSLVVMPDSSMNVNRQLIYELVASHRLPAIYPFGYFASGGGLIAYGADVVDHNRRAADYVHRILNGARAGDLPVQAPTKFELVINLKAAKAIGLRVPATLLARADEVIE